MAHFLRAWPLTNSSAASKRMTHVFQLTAPFSSLGIACRGTLPIRAHACDAPLVVDYHAALGVSSGASKLEIKRAYRRLARELHPDVCKDSSSEQWFKQINHAYESLMNRSKSAMKSSELTVCSEAGYESLEELLRWSEVGGEESSWVIAEEVCRSTLIDWWWLEIDKHQDSVDVSVFTTASEQETESDLGWLRW